MVVCQVTVVYGRHLCVKEVYGKYLGIQIVSEKYGVLGNPSLRLAMTKAGSVRLSKRYVLVQKERAGKHGKKTHSIGQFI
jgi:hypothetical protein